MIFFLVRPHFPVFLYSVRARFCVCVHYLFAGYFSSRRSSHTISYRFDCHRRVEKRENRDSSFSIFILSVELEISEK